MIKHQMSFKHMLCVALTMAAGLLASPASAADLRVLAEDAGSLMPRAAAGEFGFSVVNDGADPLNGVRIHARGDQPIRCASRTAQDRSFTLGGALRAGDRVECMGARGGAGAASVIVLARDGAGALRSRHASFSILGALTPEQGIAVLSTGAVHDDRNGNGLLDAGETIAYDYTVLNLGTLALSGLGVTDLAGPVTCPQTTLAVGASMTCTRSYTIDADDDSAGMVSNAVDVDGSDSNGGPVGSGDLAMTLDMGGSAGIRVFKSPLLLDDADASGYASAGDRVRYTFMIKNSNAQALAAVNLVEPDPSLIDTPITCAATTLGGRSFTGLGSGVLESNDVVLCAAEHTITAAEASAGIAHNLAEASGQPGVGGPVSGSGASAVVIPTGAAVAIVKTLTGESGSQPGIAEPGETLTYTLTLSNSGGADALDFNVVDQLDANTSFVSATGGGTHAAGLVTWAGLTVPSGGNLVLSVAVTVNDPLPANVTQIANLAYEAGTPPPPCPPAGPNCVIMPTIGEVAIAKALTAESGSQPGIAEPGEQLTYTITLTNRGGSAVTGFGVSDPLDANVEFVSADHGGMHDGGSVTWSGLSVPANGSVALVVVVQVVDPIPTGVSRIVNVAHETGVPPPDCSLLPAPAACVTIPTLERPRLSVSKTADVGQAGPGDVVHYTITVRNVGTVDAFDVVVSDPIPAGVASFDWQCVASSGAACPNAGGSGAIDETVPNLPAGGQLVYLVTASLSAHPPSSVLNTVSVTPAQDALCEPGSAPPCQAATPVTVDPPPTAAPIPAPVNSGFMLLLMMLAVGATALLALRRIQ